MSLHEIIADSLSALFLVIAIVSKRRGMRAAFMDSQDLAHREADTARAMATVALRNGDLKLASNLDAQADALRVLALQLDYRMASSFLKKDPQEEDNA